MMQPSPIQSPAPSQRSNHADEPSSAAAEEQLLNAAVDLRRDARSSLSGSDDPDLDAALRRLRSSVLECAEALSQLRGTYVDESRNREQLQRAVADLRARLTQAGAAARILAATGELGERCAVASRRGK